MVALADVLGGASDRLFVVRSRDRGDSVRLASRHVDHHARVHVFARQIDEMCTR